MKQISSVDLHYLVKEFKILENQRVDNFYYENETFYLRVYVRGQGHKYLTNKVSKYIYLGNSKEESSEPDNFIKYLRKYLKNSFVREIEQLGTERILKITFEVKNEDKLTSYVLYLELFANGNLVICDENNTIKNSLIKKRFKDRDVLVHREYELPPSRELSLANIDTKLLENELIKSDLTLVKFLAMKFGIGGKFAEEICIQLDADKNMNANECKEFKKLSEFLSTILNKPIDAQILKKENKIEDFYPFKFKSITKTESLPDFNSCVKKLL